MVRTNESGLFELSMETAAKSSSYKLKVYGFDGEVNNYSRPLTHLHQRSENSICILFGEGKHEEIYEKLGAHVRKIGRVSGSCFRSLGAAGRWSQCRW
jgi:1,4-alpha-glucan branching enzyme